MNTLKTAKRMMYGRAGFELLRHRLLHAVYIIDLFTLTMDFQVFHQKVERAPGGDQVCPPPGALSSNNTASGKRKRQFSGALLNIPIH